MKKLLLIALLMPLSLLAQKDSGRIQFNLPEKTNVYSTDAPGIYATGSHPEWNVSKPLLKIIQVFKNDLDNNKLIMEVDTSGVLHVYGDTLSVLKAIIKSYGIKLKE